MTRTIWDGEAHSPSGSPHSVHCDSKQGPERNNKRLITDRWCQRRRQTSESLPSAHCPLCLRFRTLFFMANKTCICFQACCKIKKKKKRMTRASAACSGLKQRDDITLETSWVLMLVVLMKMRHASCMLIQSCCYMWNFIIPLQTQRHTFSLRNTISTLGVRKEGSDPHRSWQNGGRKWSGMVLNQITAVSGFGFLFSGEGW